MLVIKSNIILRVYGSSDGVAWSLLYTYTGETSHNSGSPGLGARNVSGDYGWVDDWKAGSFCSYKFKNKIIFIR